MILLEVMVDLILQSLREHIEVSIFSFQEVLQDWFEVNLFTLFKDITSDQTVSLPFKGRKHNMCCILKISRKLACD